jgi:predicted MFS family arabinose efflux permease
VPIGLLAISLSQPLLINVSDPGAARLDRAGVVCFTGALFGLVFALQRGDAAGWGSAQVIAPLVAAAVLLVAFVVVEIRQPRAMFDFDLFRNPAFCGVSLGTYALGAGAFAQLVFVALYLQDVLGYSPLDGGLRMLPMTALVFVVPLATRRLATRVPERLMLGVGLAATALGLFLMHDVGPASRWTALLPGFVLQGFGIGIANPAIAATALGVVSRARTGMASGISNTFRLGGVATGVSALGAFFTSRIGKELSKRLPHEAAHLASVVAAGGVRAAAAAATPATRAQVVAAARVAFVAGFDEILLAGAIVTAVGAVCALALIRARDFVRAGSSPAGAEEPQAVPAAER